MMPVPVLLLLALMSLGLADLFAYSLLQERRTKTMRMIDWMVTRECKLAMIPLCGIIALSVDNWKNR